MITFFFNLKYLQLGIAIGFVVPSILVGNHEDINKMGDDLQLLNYLVAGLSTAILMVVVLCKLFIFIFKYFTSAIILRIVFQREPPTPPSAAAEAAINQSSSFLDSVKRLMSSRNFLLLFVSYGLILGVFNATSTMLNQVIVN